MNGQPRFNDYPSRELDERLANPDAYFEPRYGHVPLKYGRVPNPVPLRDLLEAERSMRVQNPENDDPRLRAAQYVLMLSEAGALLEVDEELTQTLAEEIEQIKQKEQEQQG